MEELIKRLQALKVNSVYGHQKHYFASTRKSKYHRFIGVPLLIINISIGTVLFGTFSSEESTSLKYIPIMFSYLAAALSGLQTFFNFEKAAIGHKIIAQKYLKIDNSLRNNEAEIKSGIISTKEQLVILINKYTKELNVINEQADNYRTSLSDYKKAELSFENNDVSYTANELNI